MPEEKKKRGRPRKNKETEPQKVQVKSDDCYLKLRSEHIATRQSILSKLERPPCICNAVKLMLGLQVITLLLVIFT